MNRLLRYVRRSVAASDAPVVSDRDLLARFARSGDEAAFAAIVARYASGVWAACRRLVNREHDAEDVFQATFLALAQRAGTIRAGVALPAWLHGVVRRIAANQRRAERRRIATEAASTTACPAPDMSWHEGLAVLDEELARLPERHRAVLVACCLEGRARDEAALHLGWSVGRVKGLLERGRELLRKRLEARGLTLPAVLLAATVSAPSTAGVASTVPAALLATVVRVASSSVSGSATAGGIPPDVADLAEGAWTAMTIPKLKVLLAALLATVAVGGVMLVRAVSPEPAAQQRGENVNGAATPAGAANGRADEPPTKSDPKNAEERSAEPPLGELTWGEMNNGLRLGLQGAQGRLLVTVENVGKDDVMVNLGMMLDNGKKHLPAALWLTVTGTGKKSYAMTYKQPRVAGRVDPFVVPLPAGSRYAMVLKLDDFTSPELEGALPPGRYTVAAQFSGDMPVGKTAKGAEGPAAFTYWAGSAKSGEVPVTVAARPIEVKLADIQAKYRKLPVKALKLKEPIEVRTVAYLKDGGSIIWLLRDADGADHTFRTYENPSGPVFHTTRPKDEKGRELKDGGAEQQELYGIWLRWIDKNVANAPKFLADRAAPEAKVDAAALGLTFRALERRIVELAEKGTYPE